MDLAAASDLPGGVRSDREELALVIGPVLREAEREITVVRHVRRGEILARKVVVEVLPDQVAVCVRLCQPRPHREGPGNLIAGSAENVPAIGSLVDGVGDSANGDGSR